MNCSKCNAPLPPEAAVCPGCGTPVQQASQQQGTAPQSGVPPQYGAVPPQGFQQQGFQQQPGAVPPQGFQQQGFQQQPGAVPPQGFQQQGFQQQPGAVPPQGFYQQQGGQQNSAFDFNAAKNKVLSKAQSTPYYPMIKKYGLFVAAGLVVLILCMSMFVSCGDGEDEYFKAREYALEENISKAIKYLKKSAEKGYVKAQVDLADYYYNEENNEKEALKWYRKAAKQGDSKAKRMVERIK